ncbi:hypothetical protein XW59_019500 [Aquamicrobium sp. LC103]|nr:hypothetical protein [Aquamicrobium sp. LC103]TKT75500.1 hypothetical protein XW59_019500 [Aquamicrobium sp. LC103]
MYRAPERHYHGTAHVEALLALARERRDELSDAGAVEAAIWFHDAIYDSRRNDNEARSAEFARQRLRDTCEAARLERIALMIEATATHEVPDLSDASARSDAAFFLDMDLAILGASPEAFRAYEEATRKEYAWVGEDDWIAGRSAVLRRFAGREHIYFTEPFRLRCERQARENIAGSLRRLEEVGKRR